MKTKPYFYLIIFILLSIQFLSGCHLLRNQVTDSTPAINNLSKSATENALIGANNQIDPLKNKLVKNLKEALDTLNPEIKKHLTQIMDTIGNLTAAQVKTIGLSLDAQIANIKGQVEDKQLINFFLNALDDAIGKVDIDARNAISHILESTLDTLNNTATQAKIHVLLNTLIGDSTQKQINKLTNATLKPILDDFFARLDNTENKTGKLVTHILATSAIALFLGLVLFLIMRNMIRTRDKVIDAVSLSINELKEPHAAAYDKLTKSIKQKTVLQGVEPFLKDNLEKKGIQKPSNFVA